MMRRKADSSEDEADFGAATTSGERFAAAILDYRQPLQALVGAADRQDWAETQNNLGVALQSQRERSGGAEATGM